MKSIKFFVLSLSFVAVVAQADICPVECMPSTDSETTVVIEPVKTDKETTEIVVCG